MDWRFPGDFLEHELLSPSLLVRESRDTVRMPRLRTRQISLVTTLLDAAVYSVENFTGSVHAIRGRPIHALQILAFKQAMPVCGPNR
jgi:hypothetical protein